jgi:AcrR family transcriptional regulator
MAAASKLRRELPAYLSLDDPMSKRMILQSALRLFAEQGIHAVTVRDIAKDAGYTNPALFKFFDSKDSLALFLFEQCYVDLYERLAAGAPATLHFTKRLKLVVEVFLDRFDDGCCIVMFVQEHLRALWPRVSRKTRARSLVGLIRNILSSGVEEGAVSADANLDLLGASIVGTLAQFARLLYFGEFKKPASKYAVEIAAMLHRITAP